MTTEEAIEYLTRCADGLDPDFECAVSMAVSALREKQNGGWISVKDRLPKENNTFSEFIVMIGGCRTPDDPGISGARMVGGRRRQQLRCHPLAAPAVTAAERRMSMDYKIYVNKLRKAAAVLEKYRPGLTSMISAFYKCACIIETLLAERDAALNDLRGMCWCCINGQRWEKSKNLVTCEHLKQQGILAAGGSRKCEYWQWRGPKKEADNETD